MRVDELIKELTPYKDFELQAGLVEIDNKKEGWGAVNHRWFNITGVDDIGHSSKIVVLGLEDEK
jgi:hypothetical protein